MPPLNANTTAASAAQAFAAQVPCGGTRVYIAGPMSGLPDLNYPAFRSAALVLRSHGYFVENPAENEAPEPAPTWAAWMRLGLTQMLTCSHVLLLPDWQKSKGAIIEARTALDLGIIVFDGETGAPVQSVINIAPPPAALAGPGTIRDEKGMPLGWHPSALDGLRLLVKSLRAQDYIEGEDTDSFEGALLKRAAERIASIDTDAQLLKIAADANEALRQAWGAVITALHQCDEQLFADPTQTAVEAAVSSVWRTNAARKRAEAVSA